MRKILAIAALLCAAGCADIQVVSAQGVNVYVGPGGAGVSAGRGGPPRDRGYNRGYRDERRMYRERRCRVIREYRRGSEITTRICD